MITLKSENIELIACTSELISAELESPEKLALMLNAKVGKDWPPGEYDRDAQLYFREHLENEGENAVGWYGWYAVKPAVNEFPAVLAGACGFMGPPDNNGEVEIGFSVTSDYRGMGYASEMVRMLIGYAFSYSHVKVVNACALPENHASCRVLEKCGLKLILSNSESGLSKYSKKKTVTF